MCLEWEKPGRKPDGSTCIKDKTGKYEIIHAQGTIFPGGYLIFYKGKHIGPYFNYPKNAKLFAEVHAWAKQHRYDKLLKLLTKLPEIVD